VLTCLGSGKRTFQAVLDGRCGAGPLRHARAEALNVTAGYHIGKDDPERLFRARTWLVRCVAAALRQAWIDPRRQRVAAVVGTGLRELASVEAWALDPGAGRQPFPVDRLDFGAAVPGVADVVTLSNACSAGGHALAVAQDLIELDVADAVVAAGVDAMSRSMLAMIGRVAPAPTEQVRPFDADRTGVLLGEGAAAAVVVPEDSTQAARPTLGRLLATGLSCDAQHQTAPDVDGIRRAMSDAFSRVGRAPGEVGAVVAHGTGTALNDPAECAALKAEVLAAGADPLITGVKGAVGHTSGAAALVNLDIALRILSTGRVPPVVGLRRPLPEGEGMRFVVGEQARFEPRRRIVQTNAFGFGGVNAVTLVEAA